MNLVLMLGIYGFAFVLVWGVCWYEYELPTLLAGSLAICTLVLGIGVAIVGAAIGIATFSEIIGYLGGMVLVAVGLGNSLNRMRGSGGVPR